MLTVNLTACVVKLKWPGADRYNLDTNKLEKALKLRKNHNRIQW